MSFEIALAALAALVLIGSTIVVLAVLRATRKDSGAVSPAQLETLRAGLREQIEDRDRQIEKLEAILEGKNRDNTELQARNAALNAAMSEHSRQSEENFKRLQAARQEMTEQFKAIAGDVLKSHGESFSKQNLEQVDLLLKPLGEKILEFQSNLIKDRAELGQQIQNLAVTGLKMGADANNLTKALKGDMQVQGAWGEMVLSSILTRSGLREGEQFRQQQHHSSEEARVRTDVEILLPNGDVIVIDSKVSLTAYEGYTNGVDEEERSARLKGHIESMRAHIRVLSGKEYHRNADSGLDFVFMFVPIESAFAVAVSADRELIDHALSRGVVIATPTTLISALRTIKNVWDIEKRQRNAEDIAKRAGQLYEKVAGFLETMNLVDDGLSRTRKAFDKARSQLSDGKGSVLRQIDMLKELGARTNQALPAQWAEPSASLAPLPAELEEEMFAAGSEVNEQASSVEVESTFRLSPE